METTKDQFDHIAKDAQPVEINCYNPFDKSHADRWVLRARFCSDEQVAVGLWDVVVLRFVLHASPSSITTDPFIGEALKEGGRGAVAPTQIDTTLIQGWWQDCQDNHAGCRAKARDLKSHPTVSIPLFRVIDVYEDKIVIAPKFCRYVALSYVWGGIDNYQTTKSNKSHDPLTEDEIIPFRRKRFPKTIRDALRVTKMIGERYLWVDALCIVQDDEDEKAKTFPAMNNIYRHAQLTIVAADGSNADAGLRGLDPGSRHVQSVVGSVDNIFLTLEEPAPELARSVWSTRAWTYQEQQLSRRLLIFAHDRVYYQCD
ncbi:HET-domain-containing protein, partial [Thozetella sp. PMI_491]